jgi:glutamine amidotransferase
LSVARAVEKCGAEPVIVADPEALARADCLILPGVGAFRDGMAGLARRGLDAALRDHAASGRPLLGICLGMQMLAEESVEFGRHEGLGLVPGRVVPIAATGAGGGSHKIPFIGWTEIEPSRADGFWGTPLAGVETHDAVYLLHSYHFEPGRSGDRLATYDYDGVTVTAAVARDNIIGCQFHPEKSGPTGLGIMAAFLAS